MTDIEVQLAEVTRERDDYKRRWVSATGVIKWLIRGFVCMAISSVLIAAAAGFGIWRSLQAAHDFRKLNTNVTDLNDTLLSGRADRTNFQDAITVIVTAQGVVICDIADAVGADTEAGAAAQTACAPEPGG